MKDNKSKQIENIRNSITIVNDLEERIDDEDIRPQFQQARMYLASASQNIGTGGFERELIKAIGLVSGIAVSHGHDDLAKGALELGGGNV